MTVFITIHMCFLDYFLIVYVCAYHLNIYLFFQYIELFLVKEIINVVK